MTKRLNVNFLFFFWFFAFSLNINFLFKAIFNAHNFLDVNNFPVSVTSSCVSSCLSSRFLSNNNKKFYDSLKADLIIKGKKVRHNLNSFYSFRKQAKVGGNYKSQNNFHFLYNNELSNKNFRSAKPSLLFIFNNNVKHFNAFLNNYKVVKICNNDKCKINYFMTPKIHAKDVDNISRKAFASEKFEGNVRGIHGCKISGVGSSVPNTKVSNKQLENIVETSDEWISSRTGISSRHIMSFSERLKDFSASSAKKALEYANVHPHDVDLIIYASSTSEDLFGDATYIQNFIDAKNAAAFDLKAACSGFIFGLITASQYISSGALSNVLVVGADELSKYVDWTDRNTCVLFGDGCGAVVLSRCNDTDKKKNYLLGWNMYSDGARRNDLFIPFQQDNLKLENKIDTQNKANDLYICSGKYGKIKMNGRDVFRFATKEVACCIENLLKKLHLKSSDVSWLLLHQANIRIIQNVAERLDIPSHKILSNLDEYGNTSAGSIPLCLDEAVRSGKIKTGDKVLMAGFGAGLSWGSVLIEWI